MTEPQSDTKFAAEQARIRNLVAFWREMLYLNEWRVDLQYARGPFLIDGEYQNAVGACEVQWEYRMATITWNTEETAKLGDGMLRHCFFHEVMHIHVNELREASGDLKHEERVVETLARVMGEIADRE